MKRTILLTGVVFLLAHFTSQAQFLTDNLLFTARLESTASDSLAVKKELGVASISVNSTRDTMCVNVALTQMEDSITAVGLYDSGTDSAGVLTTDLFPFVQSNRITTSLTGTQVTEAFIAGLIDGNFSLRIFTNGSTTVFSGGTFRLEGDYSFLAVMEEGQEVPPSGSVAYGLAVFKLNMDSSKLKINMITNDLTGPVTGAHLHFGFPGVSGPAIVDLTAQVVDNMLDITVDSTEFSTVLDSLFLGAVYINVHTSIYPNGEIRGQLVQDRGIAFHAMLTGDEEVPPVTTDAIGLAHVSFNSLMNAGMYHVIARDLSDSIVSAHFHLGEFGVSGPPVIDISDSINQFMISGTIDTTLINDSLLTDFLTGGIYVNLHTDQNPDGEIRGQVKRYAWEGFTYSMDGTQEEPPVVTTALGGGFTSIDPAGTRLHFMFAVAALSDTATAAHFHVGEIGEEGPTIFTLTPFLIQTKDSVTGQGALFAEGFWNDNDSPPLTAVEVALFGHDSVYVNVHTDFAPNGEVRGQVLHGTQCFTLNTGVEVLVPSDEEFLEIFPNPASDQATALIRASKSTEAVLQLRDLTGKLLWSDQVQLQVGTTEIPINLSPYAAGIYLLSVETERPLSVIKFEKQ